VGRTAYDGFMTSWGNTRQKACAYASGALFVTAFTLAVYSFRSNLDMVPLAALALVLGIICAAGVWANGLTANPDHDAEWSEAIR
jgi:hypothetical protein